MLVRFPDLEEEVAADEGEDLDGVLEDVLGGVAAGRRGLREDEERRALRVGVRAAADALHQQVGVDHAKAAKGARFSTNDTVIKDYSNKGDNDSTPWTADSICFDS